MTAGAMHHMALSHTSIGIQTHIRKHLVTQGSKVCDLAQDGGRLHNT